MKKIIYSLFVLATLSFVFVSCGKDDDEGVNYPTSAEVGASGTYTGTFTTDNNGTIDAQAGTITIAPSGQPGCINVTFACPGAGLNKTAVANVCHSNGGYQFVNQLATNPLGAAFAGRIYETGQLTVAFTLEQRVGRQQVLVKYDFGGQR